MFKRIFVAISIFALIIASTTHMWSHPAFFIVGAGLIGIIYNKTKKGILSWKRNFAQ